MPRHPHRSIDQHNRFIPLQAFQNTYYSRIIVIYSLSPKDTYDIQTTSWKPHCQVPVFFYQKLHIAKALRCPVTRTIEAKPLLSSGEPSLHNSYGIVVVLYGFHYLWFHGILSSRSNFNILQTSTYFNLIWNKETVCTCLHSDIGNRICRPHSRSPSFKTPFIKLR